jgi:hypothetical protein
MPELMPKFRAVQQSFANHIKNPEVVDQPADVDDRHMAIYRDLFFKNIMGFLSGTFPVLAEILGEKRWLEIGRDFFSRHPSKSPYFLEISREFLSYLEDEYEPMKSDPDYMYELAHYEWLELYVDVEPEGYKVELDSLKLDSEVDILSSKPVLSPVAEGFLYNYPVHQISLENPSPEPKQSALIVYRKCDDSVAFIESNPFTLQLLSLLKEQRLSGKKSINTLLKQAGFEGNQAAYQGGIDTLKQWFELELIVGSKAYVDSL